MPNLVVTYRDAYIEPYQVKKGDYTKAGWLIENTNKSNKEIALESGISKARVAPLRIKLRTKDIF